MGGAEALWSSPLAALILQLVGAGLLSLITAVITASRMAAVFMAKLEAQDQRLSKVEELAAAGSRRQAEDREALHAEEVKRLECRAKACMEFAGRGELSRLVADNTEQFRSLQSAIEERDSALHKRVTDLATAVAELKGRGEKAVHS